MIPGFFSSCFSLICFCFLVYFFSFSVCRALTAYSYTSSAIIGSMYLSATEKYNYNDV